LNQPIRIFVYGTLREGEENHYLLKEAKCLVCNCWTSGNLYDTGQGYPAMVTGQTGRVYGELYEISEEQLAQLDWLESYEGDGENNDYDRTLQTIHAGHETIGAYVYVYAPDQVTCMEKIETGGWKHRQKKQCQNPRHCFWCHAFSPPSTWPKAAETF